jgi:hypothetical protein
VFKLHWSNVIIVVEKNNQWSNELQIDLERNTFLLCGELWVKVNDYKKITLITREPKIKLWTDDIYVLAGAD